MVLLAVPTVPGPAPGQSASHLELMEASAVELPEGFIADGLSVSSNARIFAFSNSSSVPTLYWSGEGAVRAAGARVGRIVASRFVAGDTVELLDAVHQQVFRSTGGSLQPGCQWTLPIRIDAAAPAEGGWYVAGVDTLNGGGWIYAVGADGSATKMFHVPTPIDDLDHRWEIRLQPAGAGVLLSQVARPYRTRLISADGELLRQWESIRDLPPSQDEREALWIALPVVEVDGRFLQTFSDIRSDQRVFLLRSSTGELLQTAVVDSPLGFAGHQGELNGPLIALRSGVRQEVVTYTRRWR